LIVEWSNMKPRDRIEEANDDLPAHKAAPAGESRPTPSGGLAAPVKAQMESAFGADFSNVRVHEDGEAGEVGAEAFTRGSDLHFAPGRYAPESAKGQELIGHELAHVVQQSQGRVGASFQAKGLRINDDDGLEAEADAMGAKAARGEQAADLGGADVANGGDTAQCYIDQKIATKDWRVSDDLHIAVRQDTTKPAYGSHNFFADSSLITSSSSALKAQTSRLELTAGSETMDVTDGKTTKTLSRVEPKNLKDGSKGNDAATGMGWADDCGYAAQSVMQGDKRNTKGVYGDATTGAEKTTSSVNYATDETTHRGSTLYTPHMMLEEILKSTLDPDAGKAWTKYRAFTPEEKDAFDKKVGINKYADPTVGEAYSIVSNKDELVDGKSAWNFHWGGVCMKSGGDHVTMENFAGSGEHAWDFQMYGSANKAGQTFHEQQEERTHGGQAEYGDHPTTIRVRPG
jgi:Domain of unknown function (DUF4157)